VFLSDLYLSSLTSQPTSARGGKGLVNLVYNFCPAALDTTTQHEDSIQSCDALITMLTAMVSVENYALEVARSMKTWRKSRY